MSQWKNIYVQALYDWQSLLENELAALGVHPLALPVGTLPDPSPGVIPQGMDTIEWLTVQSSDYASTIDGIVRQFATTNEWPLTMSAVQVFYAVARVAAAKAWITFVIEEGISDEDFDVMPSLHDKERMLEWLLVTLWRDPLADQILRTMAGVIDTRARQIKA